MEILVKDGSTDKIVLDVDGGDSSTPGDFKVDGRLKLSQSSDVASASTIAMTNNAARITGTTNISKISTTDWQQGSVVYLKFMDTLTLLHAVGGSGQLYLKAADDTIVNEDTIAGFVLINSGVGANTWYQIS